MYNSAALKLLGITEPVSGSALYLNRAGFREVIENTLKKGHSESEMTLDGRIYSLIANAVFNEKNYRQSRRCKRYYTTGILSENADLRTRKLGTLVDEMNELAQAAEKTC